MFFVIAYQVIQGKAVMSSDEINAGVRLAAVLLIKVTAAGNTEGEFRQGAFITFPEVTDGITVFTVPFRPKDGEFTYLVSSFSNIPGFRNELDIRNDGVLMNDIKEGGQPVYIMQFPGQCRGQVKTEAIYMHFRNPVAQAVHDELEYLRVASVKAVTGTRIIHIVAQVILHETVIGGVINAFERQGRAEMVAL